jgi:hypothetical protein
VNGSSLRWRGPLLKAAAVLAVTGGIVWHIVRERKVAREGMAGWGQVALLGTSFGGAKATDGARIYVNGAPVFFRTSATNENVSQALAKVEQDCRSGDRSRMLGVTAPTIGEGGNADRTLELVRVDREYQGGAAAELCVFRDDRAGGATLVRYTLATPTRSGPTSLVTIAPEHATDVDVLFPAEGDAPGGDLEGVPRPAGSRRTFVARMEDSTYSVRLYETAQSVRDVRAQFDEQMAQEGWSQSPAVAEALPDARLYAHDGREVVALFDRADETTTITLAPFSAQ